MSEIVPQSDGNDNRDFKAFIDSFDKFEPVTGCKVCASKFRKDAELQAERGRSIAAIHRFLTEEKGEDMSYSSVKNHINYHFNKAEDQLSLQEFANKLKGWSSLNKEDVVFFNRYIDFFDMEAMELASKNKELPLPERRKNDELIIKIGQLMANYKEQLHKLNAEMRPVEVIIKSLNRIIQVKLEGSANPEVKRVLMDVIEQLLKEVGDVPLDAKGDKE